MEFRDIAIRATKKTYQALTHKKFYPPVCDCDRQSSNDKIYNLLAADNPCMISRFGTTEINCINNYLCITDNSSYIKRIYNYITNKTHTPWWDKNIFQKLYVLSGVFPPTQETAERFSMKNLCHFVRILSRFNSKCCIHSLLSVLGLGL